MKEKRKENNMGEERLKYYKDRVKILNKRIDFMRAALTIVIGVVGLIVFFMLFYKIIEYFGTQEGSYTTDTYKYMSIALFTVVYTLAFTILIHIIPDDACSKLQNEILRIKKHQITRIIRTETPAQYFIEDCELKEEILDSLLIYVNKIKRNTTDGGYDVSLEIVSSRDPSQSIHYTCNFSNPSEIAKNISIWYS